VISSRMNWKFKALVAYSAVIQIILLYFVYFYLWAMGNSNWQNNSYPSQQIIYEELDVLLQYQPLEGAPALPYSSKNMEILRLKEDDNPEYSIVMTIHNQEEHIHEPLEALFKYTTSPYEIIMILDGCTDNTEQAIDKTLMKYLSLYYPTREQVLEFSPSASNLPPDGPKMRLEKLTYWKKRYNEMSNLTRVTRVYAPNVFEVASDSMGMRMSRGKYVVIVQADNVVGERSWERRLSEPGSLALICYFYN
jgi:cellulose synthase/poly-beta-1,6-N-acetylglucosamine synthase-like glycosyltransferase